MWRVTACRCAARCCCGSSAIVRWERHHLLLLLLLCIRFRGNNHNCPMRRRQTTSRMHIHHRFCRPIPSTFFHQYWYHWKHLQELLPCLSLHYGGYPYTNEHLILPQPGGTLTIPESSCRGLKCLPLCHMGKLRCYFSITVQVLKRRVSVWLHRMPSVDCRILHV